MELLRNDHKAIDIALFGRMLADKPKFNMEAAAQVAHAITVHKAAVEDDFFSAVDDLNTGKVHAGSGHLGEAEFGAGLYYLYVCINKDHLIENLDNDRSLAEQSIRALTEAMLTVSPSGKQNNHASRAYASYVLAEKGTVQPRALSTAFLRPIGGNDIAPKAIEELKKTQENLDKVYERENQKCEINILTGEGKLSELLDFVCKRTREGNAYLSGLQIIRPFMFLGGYSCRRNTPEQHTSVKIGRCRLACSSPAYKT